MSTLPPRGTGLETGRAGARRGGTPRPYEERLARHSSFTENNTWLWILGIAGVAIAGFIVWKYIVKK